MRAATRTPKHLAVLAIAGAAALSLSACKSGTPAAAGLPTPAGAAAALPSPSVSVPAGLPSLPAGRGVRLPSGAASLPASVDAGKAVGTVGGVAGSAAGSVKGAAGRAVGSAVGTAGDAVGSVCALKDLKGSVVAPAATSGIDVGNLPPGVVTTVVKLVNTTTSSCVLDGWTGITPLSVGGPLEGVKQTRVGTAPGQVTVAAGGSVYVGVRFVTGTACPALDGLDVGIPGQSGLLRLPVHTSTGADRPLNVCPGILRTGPVSTDTQKALKVLKAAG
ncbi:DUF4232 domain-containing protein [Streptacidiphilus sp. ASG 303]|uniref:DUF4232 domain-containing protein n=1 Tax=Streptacidiphilus sp. ASG 303 TaxID=2896847 RepID=UPI001E565C81|nr:DUF4232 domain-containing protein [Streptacidiphilus sp. ASG 303]MCD0483996.1 DUF4232 domain-containing protein [Streptacidiphilus sp. ASG 303]